MIIHSRLIYIAMGRRQRYHTDRGVRCSNDEDLAPDYTPRKRQTRKKRPDQHPPMARVNEGDEERDESAMHFDCEDATREMRKKDENQYKERLTREHKRWGEQRAESTYQAVIDLPLVLASKRRQANDFIRDLQEKIDLSWMLHNCCQDRREDQSIKSFDSSS